MMISNKRLINLCININKRNNNIARAFFATSTSTTTTTTTTTTPKVPIPAAPVTPPTPITTPASVTTDSQPIAIKFKSDPPSNEEILQKLVEQYALKKESKVSLKALMETAKGRRLDYFHFSHIIDDNNLYYDFESLPIQKKVQIQVACFLHRELPVRLAKRAVELESYELFKSSENIQKIATWYKESFSQIYFSPIPVTAELEEKFFEIMEGIYEKHSKTMFLMAMGAQEIKKHLNEKSDLFYLEDIQTRLDNFYKSRIAIRILIGQYLALKELPYDDDDDNYGIISAKTSPYQISQDAICDAQYICERECGEAPEVILHGNPDSYFPYIPSHLHYILMELLKNSMRATVEKRKKPYEKLSPIRVIIADGEENEDVVIKVSDEGGGIKRSDINHIFSYLYTSVDKKNYLEEFLSNSLEGNNPQDDDKQIPLAGLGYGLPLARNYSRIFDGELVLMSMEGYGTDSYIYLPRIDMKDLEV